MSWFKWFKRKKKEYAIIDKEGKVFMKPVDDRQWVLDMYKKRGCIVDRNSLRDGR